VPVSVRSARSPNAPIFHTRRILGALFVPSPQRQCFWPRRWLCFPLSAPRWRCRSRRSRRALPGCRRQLGEHSEYTAPAYSPGVWSSTADNNATGHALTVDLAAAKLNDLYGGGGIVLCLSGPEKFRCSFKCHVHDNNNGSSNGVTNNGVYGDDGDLIVTMRLVLIVSKEAFAMVAVVFGLVRKAPHSRTYTAVSAESTTGATRWLPYINKPRWRASGWASAGSTLDPARVC
jgi:hypothetical protein